jgi:hypothetical protein
MRELLLLWLFTVAGLMTVAVVALLALGMVFSVVWLLWKGLRGLVRVFGGRGGVRAVERSGVVDATFYTPVSGRLRQSGARGSVRVQGRLVPASACVAQRGAGGVGRRRQARARRGDD